MNYLEPDEQYMTVGNKHKLIVKKRWPFDYVWHCMTCKHYGRVKLSRMSELNQAVEDDHESTY